jgi:hypothetical protein
MEDDNNPASQFNSDCTINLSIPRSNHLSNKFVEAPLNLQVIQSNAKPNTVCEGNMFLSMISLGLAYLDQFSAMA